MRATRMVALTTVSLIAVVSLAGSLFPHFDYRHQDREHFFAPPSHDHWLGTDALGRDRLARLLQGTQVSLSLAPAAASVSILMALAAGAVPGFIGGAGEGVAKMVIDLMLSVPWLFPLLMVRAILPLNISPLASAAITFLMLGVLGWGIPARILLARSRKLRQSEFVLLARASGVSQGRLFCVHVMPNLRPVLVSQFWIAIPIFVLTEANLSLLGLGVAEPLPSLGSLLRELETALSIRSDVCNFAALFVLVLVVSSLQIAFAKYEVS